MKTIALTGNICCGKTTVLKMFGKLGAETASADRIVEELYKKNKIKQILMKNFGKRVFSGKKIDKKKIADIIFSSRKERKKLESIVHAFVFREMKKRIARARKKKKKLFVAEVPLLFESEKDFFSLFDFVCVVSAAKKQQIARARKEGFSVREIRERMKVQIPLEKKIKRADFVVDNSGSVSETREQVKEVFWILTLT